MWRVRTRRMLLGFVFIVLVLAVGLSTAFADGAATLTVTPSVVPPGGTITVRADGVEPGEVFTIVLQGTLYEATLGTVEVTEGDGFRQEFLVPEDVPTGFYQVQATSAEGEVLTAELTVEAGAEESTPVKPSAEPLQLDRQKTPLEWGIILTSILVSAVLGIAMIRVSTRLERDMERGG